MDKEFISYKQALELKNLGYDKTCFVYSENGNFISCGSIGGMGESFFNEFHPKLNPELTGLPLFSQVFKWFREEHKINSTILPHLHYDYDDGVVKIKKHYKYSYSILEYSDSLVDMYNSYEKAELACLKQLIEVLKYIKDKK